MRVAHLKRMYLLRTETFVYTQLRQAAAADTLLLCRDLENREAFPGIALAPFEHALRAWRRIGADAMYRTIRSMAPLERAFYVHTIERFQPSLLHAHYAVDAGYFLPVKQRTRLPLVVSCYGYDVSNFPNAVFGFGRRYLAPVWEHADLVLAMSQDMRRDIVRTGCPDEKVRIHYHGIDLTRFPAIDRPRQAGAVRVLFVGSLATERKGVADIIRAFALLASLAPSAELRIVGDGSLRPGFEQLARDLGIRERVTFVGFVAHERLRAELAQADLFCHPSVTSADGNKEGIPGAIVEAMASGLPVVSTRHAGIPEMVRDGTDGILVCERDVAALGVALGRLIQDPELRERMGRSGAIRTRELADARRQSRALQALYSELIERRPGAVDSAPLASVA